MYKVKAELYDQVFDKKKEAGGATSSAPTIQQVMSAECERLHAVYREMAEAEIQKTTQYREKYIEQMNLAQTQKLMLQELEQRATEVV